MDLTYLPFKPVPKFLVVSNDTSTHVINNRVKFQSYWSLWEFSLDCKSSVTKELVKAHKQKYKKLQFFHLIFLHEKIAQIYKVTVPKPQTYQWELYSTFIVILICPQITEF